MSLTVSVKPTSVHIKAVSPGESGGLVSLLNLWTGLPPAACCIADSVNSGAALSVRTALRNKITHPIIHPVDRFKRTMPCSTVNLRDTSKDSSISPPSLPARPAIRELSNLLGTTWRITLKDDERVFTGKFLMLDRRVSNLAHVKEFFDCGLRLLVFLAEKHHIGRNSGRG